MTQGLSMVVKGVYACELKIVPMDENEAWRESHDYSKYRIMGGESLEVGLFITTFHCVQPCWLWQALGLEFKSCKFPILVCDFLLFCV